MTLRILSLCLLMILVGANMFPVQGSSVAQHMDVHSAAELESENIPEEELIPFMAVDTFDPGPSSQLSTRPCFYESPRLPVHTRPPTLSV